MEIPKTDDLLQKILQQDSRYAAEGYFFVQEALSYTVKQLDKPRHISGQELLDGIRAYALQQFGPLAKRVLKEWGITRCEDFGFIVFNLVEAGLLGKTEDDSMADFSNGYDFEDAFSRPFHPKNPAVCPLSLTPSSF